MGPSGRKWVVGGCPLEGSFVPDPLLHLSLLLGHCELSCCALPHAALTMCRLPTEVTKPTPPNHEPQSIALLLNSSFLRFAQGWNANAMNNALCGPGFARGEKLEHLCYQKFGHQVPTLCRPFPLSWLWALPSSGHLSKSSSGSTMQVQLNCCVL